MIRESPLAPAPRTLWLVTEGYEPSGVGEHMLALAEAAVRRWGVIFSCPPGSLGEALRARAAALGCRIHAIETAWTNPYLAEVPAFLRRNRIDLCHIHAGIAWEGLGLVPLLRQAGVPAVIRTEHLPHVIVEDAAAAYARTWPLVDRIVCVSEDSARSYRAAGIAPERLAVIPNGVAPRPAGRPRDAVRSALGIGADAPVVLTVARFSEQKDYPALLASAEHVLARAPDVRFVWAGTGPLEADMRAAVAERGLAGSIRLLGHREDVPDLLTAADLFALSSRFEGLPLSVLEAMTAGLPVVATKVSGTAEAVADGATGLLVSCGESGALAEAILKVLSSPDRGAAMGAAGRQRAEKLFGVEAMVRRTLALYEEVLAKAAPSPSHAAAQRADEAAMVAP